MNRLGRFATSTFVAIVSISSLASGQTSPLNFENNYFVTGDYVVAGWANKQVDPNRAGYAIGTISLPDTVQAGAVKTPQAGVLTQVPDGADIVAAFLYWTTVEKSQSALAGQSGFFRGYPITGSVLGASNAPVSWSSGGCAGASNGTTTMRAYRADVRAYLPVDSSGVIRPNTAYTAELADSGSNGNAAPFTLGATLVIVYRVMSPNFPLNAIVIYDSAFAPGNSGSTMTQALQGFYQPAAGATAKMTQIVGNGQSKKNQTVSLNSTTLAPLYGRNLPTFPGLYNGSWDNPTWNVSTALNAPPNDPSETTSVVPAPSNSGCVSWGAIIFSTTVQDSDNDGLLDYWEQAPPNPVNPNPAGSSPGYVDVGSGQFVALPGADPNKKDIFIQADYLCSIVNPNGSCDTTNGYSFLPQPQAFAMLSNAFGAKGINLHFNIRNAIQEQACTDSVDANGNPVLCPFPNQPGVVPWKAGVVFLKNQPLNKNSDGSNWTEAQCEANLAQCVRRFQPGRKDSYHYAIFGHAIGAPKWDFQSGSLLSAVPSSNAITFTTSAPHGLVVDPVAGNGRVNIVNGFSNPSMNGTFLVQSTPSSTSFTIQVPTATAGPYTKASDPYLAIASGQTGTGSGASDVGGEDSLITLGLWGADGQAVGVQGGTFMHEVGHSLALAHGGIYHDTAGSYLPTYEANCKPNYQSVMNYLFQVDLLDGSVADYSEQGLNALNEASLFGSSVSTTDGSPTAYATTQWYAVNPPEGVGSPATHHCDGTPILSNDPNPVMFRVGGSVSPILPAWTNFQDINFDGDINASMRGYDDWANLDLRQLGATGSLSVALGLNSVGLGLNSVGLGLNSVGLGLNSVGLGLNSVGLGLNSVGLGIGDGDLTHLAANSVVRPPRTLMLTPNDTRTSHSATLNWMPPTFGQIGSYNVYRGTGNATPTLLYPTSNAPLLTATSFTDATVSDCTTYTYFVTAVLALPDGRESTASNTVSYSVPCPVTNLAATQGVNNGTGYVTLNWAAASTAAGAVYGYNVYRNSDTTPRATVLSPATTFNDATVSNNTTYTYYVTAVLVDNTGCQGNTECRESTQASVTITVQFKLSQTINFPQLPDKTYGDADFTVSATASSGLPVSFSAAPAANCTLGSGNTVHIVHAGSCTVTASQAGNADYYPAPDVPNTFTIKKANATISVTGYNLTYDGNAHSATGTATGVFHENLAGLDLSGTTHTNAGNYNDAWTFTDVTGNYNNANGAVADVILKANPKITVAGYNVPYDGNAHTATGSAIGVKGENLSGLNLSGTTHTLPATYADSWTFTDVTGNYNNASGGVTDVIVKGNTTTAISSITPSPSILGQSFTVNFKVAAVSGPAIPTGTVTVSDASGANCSVTLAGGIGSCVLTLPVLVNNLAVVGSRSITASYGGDANFTGSNGVRAQQVSYNFIGFLTPLRLSAYSGSFNFGKTIPLKWQLTTSSGAYINLSNLNLAKVSLTAYFNGQPVNGSCPVTPVSTVYLVLFNAQYGAAGNSTFRYDTTNNQFIFNWDTTSANDGTGCYTLSLQLDDGSTAKTTSLLLR